MNMESAAENRLVGDALAAVEQSTGLKGKVLSYPTEGDAGFDAIVEMGGQRLVVEAKRLVDRVSVISGVRNQLARNYLEGRADGTLLVSEYLSPVLLQTCREVGLNAADASGNVFLRSPGNLVFVSGFPRRSKAVSETLGWTSAAVRIGLVLLSQPERSSETFRNLSDLAGVSLGSVGRTLEWFEDRRFLVIDGPGKRRTIRSDELLGEWAIAYAARVRPRLKTHRFDLPISPEVKWWKHSKIAPAVWSGETAAAKMYGDVRPATFEIYVNPSGFAGWLSDFVRSNRLRANHNGPVVIRERFWGPVSSRSEVAPLPVIYSDLLSIPDPRVADQAELVRRDFQLD
jgi:hypothetical protein